MRIMYFAGGGDIGGAKTHILSLGRELAKDNAFHLVSFRPGPFAEEAESLGLSVSVAPHPWNLIQCLNVALEAVREFKPDVIHCHGTKANMMGVLVKMRTHIPVLTTVHSDPARDYMGMPLKQAVFGNINLLALKHMDFYMSVATRMEESLIHRGVDPQKIFIIHNGLDFSTASETPRPVEKEGDIVVGIAARLTPIKNISTLLKAFAIAHEKNPRLRLKIAGIGEEENELRSLAKKLGIADRVDFVGWITDMERFFADVDINVLSSFSETFPYSLLEGAFQHCPAIASAVGGIPELIEHGKSGFLFRPDDAETFADYIYRVSVDGELRQKLGEGLFRRAKDLFSLDHMRDTQLKAYETVIQRVSHRKERRGAVICGAYGRGNAGDEAILQAIVSQMRGIDPDMPLTVMSRNKQETRLRNHTDSIFIFNVFAFLRKLKHAKIFINGGGSLIQDVTSSRSLYFYLFTLWAARLCGCRVIMYGCGIGPINHGFNRRIAGNVLNHNVEVITLRDSISVDVLGSMGVTNPTIRLSADPTVTLVPASAERVQEIRREIGIPENAKVIGFCLRNWPTFTHPEYFAAAADYAYDKYGLTPVFIPIELPRDVSAAEKVTAYMKQPHFCGKERYRAEELIALLGSMEAVVGMRLHSLIFATSGGAPVIGVSYDVKVDSFFRDIHSDAAKGLESLSAEWLIHEIDRLAAMDFPRAEEAREILRAGERINTDYARKLLEE